MCPRCDGPAHNCKFEVISESCTMSKFTALFDNGWMVLFALFMAVWAKVFCIMWKRRQMTLGEKWNLEDESGDTTRMGKFKP